MLWGGASETATDLLPYCAQIIWKPDCPAIVEDVSAGASQCPRVSRKGCIASRANARLCDHSKLTELAQQQLDAFLLEDFEGASPEATADGWFRPQAAVLDGLLVGIQAELAVYD